VDDPEVNSDSGSPAAVAPPPPAAAMPANAAGTPGASGQSPNGPIAQSPVTLAPKPPTTKRTGLAGVVDDMLDDLAGTRGAAKLKQGEDGNYYVDTPELSRKGQWLKIAGEALHGAAAGAAVAKGPGGAWRGAEAGIQAGEQDADKRAQRDQSTRQEARAANVDRFNAIKLQHDKAMWAFDESAAKAKGTEDEIKFNQEEITHEVKPPEEGGLGSQDLGVHANMADLATQMQKTNPAFWKQVYGDQHGSGVVGYKEFAPDGTVTGIHFFARVPGVNGQVLPEDQATFKVFVPGKTPEDTPHFETQKATVPLSVGKQTTLNSAADNLMSQWKDKQAKAQEEADKHQRAEDVHAAAPGERAHTAAETAAAVANAAKKETGKAGYVEKADGTVWIANEGDAKAAGLPFEEMKPGDINKDKQAMRQLNDVQLNTSRYTKAAQAYADPNAPLTYHGKPVSEANPVHPQGPLSLIGLGGAITDPEALRDRDNTNLNTLMNKAGYLNFDASISAGGHITVPVITAFGESLSRETKSRAYNELSDQAKELYDGYVRTMASIPAYQKALTGIGRSNKEMLDLELANIAHPGMAPGDIVRKQAQFQQNIDKATDGFPRNMVGVKHPSQTRREVEGPPPAQRAPASDVSFFSGAAQQ
jgi:hypothetical protein